MGELNSVACSKCGEYSGVYGGLCGDCILLEGKAPVDFDLGLRLKQKIRDREVAEGRFIQEAVDAARADLAEQPKESGPTLNRKPQ